MGVPVRKGSITPGRCDLAPTAIRASLAKFSTFDVQQNLDLRDLSVVELPDQDVAETEPENALKRVSKAVKHALTKHSTLVVFGGNNSITRPCFYGLGSVTSWEKSGLLTLDAHLDLRDLADGLTNGNPVRALLDDGLRGENVVQVGIQSAANSKTYMEIAHSHGITVVSVEQVRKRGVSTVMSEALTHLAGRCDVIYVDVDLDVLDRTFAPGTSGSRPGGLLPWELIEAVRICGAHPKVRVIDFVEVDPTKDVADVTILSAARCFLAFASGLASRV